MGLHRSRRVVLDLAGLFMIDAFAGGLVVQSLLAYWFHIRYGVDPVDTWRDLLRSQFVRGVLGTGCREDRRALRPASTRWCGRTSPLISC